MQKYPYFQAFHGEISQNMEKELDIILIKITKNKLIYIFEPIYPFICDLYSSEYSQCGPLQLVPAGAGDLNATTIVDSKPCPTHTPQPCVERGKVDRRPCVVSPAIAIKRQCKTVVECHHSPPICLHLYLSPRPRPR